MKFECTQKQKNLIVGDLNSLLGRKYREESCVSEESATLVEDGHKSLNHAYKDCKEALLRETLQLAPSWKTLYWLAFNNNQIIENKIPDYRYWFFSSSTFNSTTGTGFIYGT